MCAERCLPILGRGGTQCHDMSRRQVRRALASESPAASTSSGGASQHQEGERSSLNEHIFTRSRASWAAFFTVPAVVSFGLGCWQVMRLQEKRAKVAEREAALLQDPVEWHRAVGDGDVLNPYRRVRVQGVLEHDKTVLVLPRSAPIATPEKVKAWGGATGALVLTPLRVLRDGKFEERILVNRGWVSNRMSKRPKAEWDPALQRADDIVEFDAIVGAGDSRRTWTPENVPEKGTWHWIDLDALTISLYPNATECLGYVEAIDLARRGDDSQQLFPKGLEDFYRFPTMPRTHIDYAVTWFLLSIILSAYAIYFYRRKNIPPKRKVRAKPVPQES
ncbi:SURF1-like protein [Porphyridium purpureum]|uniref:SURF1-like protein n=1 Tax=Porphyridium purpureum TaxID=35688 RepID=A0A5J4YYW0_PORPP|nr:SURF1-like protein [Porphyridium purpureum]|eukprot:POR0187..scf208_2